MSASDILSAAQSFHANQFPAQLMIAGVEYAGACSPLSRMETLTEGPGEARRRVSFWFQSPQFKSPQSLPREMQTKLECLAPAQFRGLYLVENVLVDPAASTVTLRCRAIAQ